MIYGLPFQTQRVFRPTMLEAFNITNTQLGDMFAAYGLTAMFSYFFGGPFADRYSARSLMAVSLVATAAGGLYMATIPGVWGMTVLYAFWGVSTSFLFWAALIKATRDWGGRDSQGVAFGVLDGGRGLLAAISATIAVWILARYLPDQMELVTNEARNAALNKIILYYSALTLAAAAIVWFLLPHDESMVNTRRNPFAGVPEVLRRPSIWMQAGIVICAYCGYKGLDNYSLYAVQVLGMNEVNAAILSTWGIWVRPVACIFAGLVADRFDSTRSIMVAFIVLVVAYGVLSFNTPDTTTKAILIGNLFVTFFAVFALRGIYYALLEETDTPKHLTGASVAVIAFIGYTPEVFFGPITGRILDANPGIVGWHNYFLFLTVASAIGIAIAVALLLRNRQRVAVST